MVSVQYEPHFSMFPGHHHHHPHHQNTWSCAAPPPICYQQQPPTPQYNTQDISGQYHHHHHHLQHMSHSVVQHYQDNSSYSPHHSAPPPWLYAAQAPAPRAMEWSPPFATTIQRDNSLTQQHQASATQSNCFDILQRQEHSPSLPSPSSISETSTVGDRVNQSNLGQGSPAKSDSPSYTEWLKKSEYDNLAENKKWKTRTKEKYRVVYSDRQRLELEKEFHYNRYITLNRKAEISKALDLTERQVKIWFQNRRAKERKENKKRTDKELSSPSSSTKSGLEDDVKDRFMDISSSVQATSPEMKVRELSPPLNQQLMYHGFSDNEPILSSSSSSNRGLSGGNLVSQPNYRDSNTVQHSGHSMISPTRSFVHIKDDNLGIPSIKSEYTL